MLRLLRNIFSRTNSMESSEEYEILDLLAYYCSELVEKLQDAGGNEEIEKSYYGIILRKLTNNIKVYQNLKKTLIGLM